MDARLGSSRVVAWLLARWELCRTRLVSSIGLMWVVLAGRSRFFMPVVLLEPVGGWPFWRFWAVVRAWTVVCR